MSEYIGWSFELTKHTKAYPNRLFALVDIYIVAGREHQGFLRQASRSYFDGDNQYRALVRRASIQAFTDVTRRMWQSGALRSDVNPHILSEQLSCIANMLVFEWAVGLRSIHQLRSGLIDGFDLILQSTVTGTYGKTLVNWCNNHKNDMQ